MSQVEVQLICDSVFFLSALGVDSRFRLFILEKVGLVLLRAPLAIILALVFDLERV